MVQNLYIEITLCVCGCIITQQHITTHVLYWLSNCTILSNFHTGGANVIIFLKIGDETLIFKALKRLTF